MTSNPADLLAVAPLTNALFISALDNSGVGLKNAVTVVAMDNYDTTEAIAIVYLNYLRL